MLVPMDWDLNVFIVKIFLVVLFFLIVGDALSNLLYSLPERIFGEFDYLVHYRKNLSLVGYLVSNNATLVLLDQGNWLGFLSICLLVCPVKLVRVVTIANRSIYGFLAAFPSFIFVPWFGSLSSLGSVSGELQILWRLSLYLLKGKTLNLIQFLFKTLLIVKPKPHCLHQKNTNLAHGNLFTFYDYHA